MIGNIDKMKQRCFIFIGLVAMLILFSFQFDRIHTTKRLVSDGDNSGNSKIINISCQQTNQVSPSLFSSIFNSRSKSFEIGNEPTPSLPVKTLTGESESNGLESFLTDLFKSNESRDASNNVIPDINCDKLAYGDQWEFSKAVTYHQNLSTPILKPEEFLKSFTKCSKYIRQRGYLTQPVSPEEAGFPIAFSILIYKDIEQFERLLVAIYRPQNYYCVHVDNKSSAEYHRAVETLTGCFDNVFLSPTSYDVQWGQFSVVQPELACMEILLKYKKWKYFINLTGQEFPLKTNWQIVEILKIYNGANNLEGTVKRRNTDRTHPTRPNPPVNVTLTKGSVHITASRAFIEYLIHDSRSLMFRDWVKDTYVSDETYFSSLNHSPQLEVPGAFLGVPETDTKKNLFITRFKNWGDGPFDWPCGGQRVRQVCVFGVRDLPLLYSRPELFANKFYMDFQQLTFQCVEKRLHDCVRSELESGRTFVDKSFYSDLDFVKNHLKVTL